MYSFCQVDLMGIKYLTKIATQCRDHATEVICVTSYYVKVKSAADESFTTVCGTESCPQLFTGNDANINITKINSIVTNEFDWPIAARFVRLNPQSWTPSIAMRWELYGCETLDYRPSP